jgi:uncharacterized Zn finger protein
MARKRKSTDPFADVSWVDLNRWAGGKIVGRGRSYQEDGLVYELCTFQNGLLAWVEGTERYATYVERNSEGGLQSSCTCPYEGNCKHAVAVVLEYLDCLEKGTPVPRTRKNDERFEEFGMDDDGDDEFESEEEERTPAGKRGGGLDSFLEGMSRNELIGLVRGMAERHPPVRAELADRKSLSQGKAGALVRNVRRKIREVAAEPGWQDHWNRSGYIPDYAGVRSGLAALLEAGCSDEVLGLGEELLESGTRHVEESDDEGETAQEIVSCAEAVEKALERSPRPTAEKLLWAVGMLLRDGYELFAPVEKFLERPHAKKDWSVAADGLLEKLAAFRPSRGEDEWSRNYERDRLSDSVILALTKAGRNGEVIPLCEREAKKTGSYERLVRHLFEAGRHEEAETRIFEGLKAIGGKWPGIDSNLRRQLLQIRKKKRDPLGAASLHFDEFVRSPSFEAYADCERAAVRKGLWPRVRQGLMNFLVSGAFPWDEKDWPLPDTGLAPPAKPREQDLPMRSVLIEIAIREKQPDQVLRWYDQRPGGAAGVGWMADRVATAVMEYAPERAAALWKKLAEREIAAVKPSAYEAAAVYLRKLSSLLKKLDSEAEWKAYLAGLRAAHARKRRLMEILDTLEKGPILKAVRR